VRIEFIEWDEENVEHATRHGVSAAEIEQAIANASTARRNKRIDSVTDGGRHVVVIATHDLARRSLRPITAWGA
jgi:uncharacterized DUF497 family protein